MLPRPPSSPLFPYTTLFRSCGVATADSFSGNCAKRNSTKARDFGRPDVLPCANRIRNTSAFSISESRRSEEHTSELQSRRDLVCRLLLEKKKIVVRNRVILY